MIRLILNLDDGRRTPATVPTADTSATSSSGARGQTVPVAPVAPVAAAPGKSTNTASGTKSPSRSTISSQTGSSKKSSSISVSFSATGSRPSGQSTGATSQGQALPAALMIPGIAPVPSPMLAPELMVTKGYGFYSGFGPACSRLSTENRRSCAGFHHIQWLRNRQAGLHAAKTSHLSQTR